MDKKDPMLSEFNQHQQDARARTDTLAKAIFVLAGGALTLSINAFTGKNAVPVPLELVAALQWSWGLLFNSVVFLVLLITLVLINSFVFGERWRRQLYDGEEAENLHLNRWYWFFGIGGVVSFLVGFGLMAYVAISLVNPQC